MKKIIEKVKKKTNHLVKGFKNWFSSFKRIHPVRFRFSFLALGVVSLTIFFRILLSDSLIHGVSGVPAPSSGLLQEGLLKTSIEESVQTGSEDIVKGVYIKSDDKKMRTDVGFIDLRILTLEDFFRAYKSPLEDYSDEFIEACERYDVNNWQLLPAIAMAETAGCKTGYSHEQRNCWGWGGSEPNRWEFYTYEEAIDLITYRMKRGYGNKYLNAKDIQSTYCGQTCMEWGWRWAQGVDYYVRKINDFGQRYGLKRTHEIKDWTWEE
ncbi:MAG: hypothetical protein PHS44_08205 [Candidatus Dojkabacteria bacterium]|jgi:hypothetical protein|nr:hypothetical protein [Candidatus Dojkabacteria bacterium]